MKMLLSTIHKLGMFLSSFVIAIAEYACAALIIRWIWNTRLVPLGMPHMANVYPIFVVWLCWTLFRTLDQDKSSVIKNPETGELEFLPMEILRRWVFLAVCTVCAWLLLG